MDHQFKRVLTHITVGFFGLCMVMADAEINVYATLNVIISMYVIRWTAIMSFKMKRVLKSPIVLIVMNALMVKLIAI